MLVFLIRELRIIKKITLKQMKEQTGISISYLNKIENNKVKNPSLLVMVKIAEVLNSKLDDIYYIESEINGLKKALNVYIEAYGINNEKTIKFSKKVNEAINKLTNQKNS